MHINTQLPCISCKPWLLILGIQQAVSVAAQAGVTPALDQSDTWAALAGSPLHIQASDVIAASGVDNATAQAVQVAVDFERSNWATGSVLDDPIYCLPDNASSAIPGDVLKVEQQTNATKFTIPPNIAISRFMYQTETFNGSSIPATAFVLWPWMPRHFDNVSGIPTVAWAHGTSGLHSECAPSHLQNLWYQYSAPFTLALQGYAVVGVDYAGLGINKTADGTAITHQWGAHQAGANDIFYAIEAAQKAWPSELSPEFAVMGHSQGGGVAWASAQRQLQKPVPGYLGSVAGSPTTDFSAFVSIPAQYIAPQLGWLAPTVGSIFPDFQLGDWLSPAGLQAQQLYRDLGGCQSVDTEAFGEQGVNYANPEWNETWYASAFNQLISVDGKPFAGPLLVLQGTADPVVRDSYAFLICLLLCQRQKLDLHTHSIRAPKHQSKGR